MLMCSNKLIIFFSLSIVYQINVHAYSFDTTKYHTYIDSIKFYSSKAPEKAIKLGKELLLFTEKNKNEDELEKIYEGLSLAYYFLPDKKEALTYLNLQKNILHKKNDYTKLASLYNRIGSIFHDWSLLTEAINYYNKAYHYALKSNNLPVLGQTYNNLGLINKDQGNYDKAYEYFIKAKEIYEQQNDNKSLSYTLNNIGIIYKRIKSYEKAIDYFNKSLEIKKKINDKRTIANTYGNIGETYLEKKDYNLAEKYFNEALILHTEIQDNDNILKDILALAKINCLTNKLSKAQNYLLNVQPLINKSYSKDLKKYFLEVQILYYKKSNKYKEAFELSQQLMELKDSIFNEQLIQKSVELEYLLNTELKEHELNNLKIEHQIALEKIRKNLTSKYVLILILIVLLSVIIIILVRLKIGLKSKIAIEEKNIEIEKINEELISTNEELEDKVKQRTYELTNEIKKKEEALKKLELALKKAEESNYFKEAFLSNINYEIRTPLSSIIGLSEVLKKQININDHPHLIKYIDGILQSSNRLLNILNNIIDASCIETNNIKPHIEICNTNKLVKKVGDLFTFRANEKKLELTYSLGEVPNILCDEEILFKILVEVIDNALKYTNKGKIEISTTPLPMSNEVKISISDTGIGIDESLLPNIFDYNIHKNKEQNQTLSAIGIGLPVARKLIKQMNGRIEVSSKKNFGTTVNIIIPSADTNISSEIDKQKIETIINNQKGKILLVEDDDFNALFLTSILEPIAKTTWVKSGIEAIQTIEKLKDFTFDIVILDINLPNQYEGTTLLKEIKEKFPNYLNVPFIAQTAYSLPSDREKIKDCGFSEYFAKPIDIENFLNTIKIFLNKKGDYGYKTS